MQTISDNFKKILYSQNPRYIKQVFLTPRKFENGAEVYGPAADVSARVIEIAPIKWKLDTEGYSVWNTPNTTITFADTDGAFAAGGAFFKNGFDIYKSKITIYAGVTDGKNIEMLPMFEGYVLDSPVYQPEEKTVNVTALGRFAVLAETDAEQISLSVAGAKAAAVDARTYNTPGSSVSRVIEVRKGADFDTAAVLVENYDYTISSLNLYKKPAAINLKADVNTGNNIWVSYIQWYEDKDIDWIVSAVADAAGITDRDIEPVTFENSVVNNFTEGGGAVFGGTCDGTAVTDNAVTLSGVFPAPVNLTDWTSVEKPATTTWTFLPDGVIAAGSLSSYASAKASQTLAYGTWEFTISCNWDTQKFYYHFVSSTGIRTSSNGYAISYERTIGAAIYLRIYRADLGTLKAIAQPLISIGSVPTEIAIRVTRMPNGDFAICFRQTQPSAAAWQSIGVVCNDVTYTSSVSQIAVFYTSGLGNYISGIKISSQTAAGYTPVAPQGDYTSPVIYVGDNLSAWGAFDALQTVPSGGAGSFFIRTKNNSSDVFGSWQAIKPGDTPSGGFKYVQLKWSAKANLSSASVQPVLISWRLAWYSGSTKISVVNTGGLNGQDVVKALAQFSTFETGFDRNGKFIFRARNKNTAAAAPLGPRDVYRTESVNTGLDYVYNIINAEIGAYKETVNSYTQKEASPNSVETNGRREMTLPSSAFLPPESVDMAQTLAMAVYSYLCKKRRRAAVVTRFMPQLDLSDIVKISCSAASKYPRYLDGVFMTVDGIEFDLENWTTRLDLTEVL